ncbi:hypothetical protein FSARC_1695 [Fusarium sarcochroum]|uniref:Uncharacterized protein n=1 Tax=Fusarium sarcochroum TaxID=1208366 RepID=A0A8H4U808_9HYPO|nr:hypothetical protein FSARC_1695 [Fusarium sarcochroum]
MAERVGTDPSVLQPSQPNIRGLVTTHRYFKYYEYSMDDIGQRLHNDVIIDLKRWRRRSKQSQHKLTVLAEFVNYWLNQEPEKKHWVVVVKDIRYTQW